MSIELIHIAVVLLTIGFLLPSTKEPGCIEPKRGTTTRPPTEQPRKI